LGLFGESEFFSVYFMIEIAFLNNCGRYGENFLKTSLYFYLVDVKYKYYCNLITSIHKEKKVFIFLVWFFSFTGIATRGAYFLASCA
jgi:hypothetical protein